MRKIFRMRLFVCVAGAFLITAMGLFILQSTHARHNAETLLSLRISDARTQLRIHQHNLESIELHNERIVLTKTHVLARMIEDNPEILTSKGLHQAAALLDVDEINVADGRGVVVATTAPRYLGFDMSSSSQSQEFMGLLEGSFDRLVQPVQPVGFDQDRNEKVQMQYSGVLRRDAPGFVQIGMFPKRLLEAMELADIENLALGFRVGAGGSLIICDGEHIVSAKREWDEKNVKAIGLNPKLFSSPSFNASIEGVSYICVARDFGNYTIVAMLPKSEMYEVLRDSMVALIVGDFLLFVVVFMLISRLVKKLVIDGIHRVNCGLSEITAGNLDVRIDEGSSPEFIALSEGINATVQALKDAIEREAARIDKELDIARTIQLSAIPTAFPVFTDRDDFDLFALIQLAREVGGDFYDFDLLEGSHLAFVIADVSGKGIPGAMFMMESRTVIRNGLSLKGDLGEMVSQMNRLLCQGNEADMFVTAFIALLNLKNGEMTYVNAGHNPPGIFHEDGSISEVTGPHGLVLAGIADYTYVCQKTKLKPGDTLLLYTDGITEAMNESGEMFGPHGLRESLENRGKSHHTSLLQGIARDVATFGDKVPQYDDMTLLGIRWFGPLERQSLTVPARVGSLEEVQMFLARSAAGFGFSNLGKVPLAVEEAFVNIAHYAYDEAGGDVTVECFPQGRALCIRFSDRGRPFDPLQSPPPNLHGTLEERPVGGLGVYLMKKIMDVVTYSRQGECNILTMKKQYL